MASVVKVKGVPFEFGDLTLIIPPLSLGAMEQLQERLAGMSEDLTSPEYVGTVIDTLHAALKRNYPEITREEVANLIDLENMQAAMACAMDVAGLKRKSLEAEQGEEPGKRSAGQSSMRTSRTGPAGRSRTSGKS